MKKQSLNISEIARLSAFKLQGLAYLTELQSFADTHPENPEEVFYGLGLIFQEIAQDLKELSNKIENVN